MNTTNFGFLETAFTQSITSPKTLIIGLISYIALELFIYMRSINYANALDNNGKTTKSTTYTQEFITLILNNYHKKTIKNINFNKKFVTLILTFLVIAFMNSAVEAYPLIQNSHITTAMQNMTLTQTDLVKICASQAAYNNKEKTNLNDSVLDTFLKTHEPKTIRNAICTLYISSPNSTIRIKNTGLEKNYKQITQDGIQSLLTNDKTQNPVVLNIPGNVSGDYLKTIENKNF